jgi:hypothetical protein
MTHIAGGINTGDGNSIQERTIFKNPKSFRISLWLIFSIGYNFSYENESAACGAKTVIRSRWWFRSDIARGTISHDLGFDVGNLEPVGSWACSTKTTKKCCLSYSPTGLNSWWLSLCFDIPERREASISGLNVRMRIQSESTILW